MPKIDLSSQDTSYILGHYPEYSWNLYYGCSNFKMVSRLYHHHCTGKHTTALLNVEFEDPLASALVHLCLWEDTGIVVSKAC